MNIHEYQAKNLLKDYDISVPEGWLAESAEQAKNIAEREGRPLVVKAQVHTGGRGKAGGVKLVGTAEQAAQFTEGLLGSVLVTHQTGEQGLPVNSVYLESTCDIAHEYYLSLLVDRGRERIVIIASAAGGMDIEAIAETQPDKIVTVPIHPATGLQGHHVRTLLAGLDLPMSEGKAWFKLLDGLYRLVWDKDASQVEINPLVRTGQGDWLALDAKINFDDNALYAHPDISGLRDSNQEDAKETLAREHDLNYIALDGAIGCMVNGAGLAMATMDLVKLKGGLPANFLDVGGGADKQRVTEAFKLILADPNVKAVLVNIFGGIVKCDIIAEGILAAIEEVQVSVPVVVRLEGTHAEQGRKLLNESGLKLTAAENLSQAAELAVTQARAA
ncbi:MAG: ADP-forming succinate--CoA ligase subunit beta [Methylococcales bacterium]|nr:ADP-forming succinate--CoA ligase subunit beta [Methylococcales bacterium]